MLQLDLHALLHGPGTWTNLALAQPVWGPNSSMLEAGNDKTGGKKTQIPVEVPECKGEVLTLSHLRTLLIDPHVPVTP